LPGLELSRSWERKFDYEEWLGLCDLGLVIGFVIGVHAERQ
jgi:hypothetical protein